MVGRVFLIATKDDIEDMTLEQLVEYFKVPIKTMKGIYDKSYTCVDITARAEYIVHNVIEIYHIPYINGLSGEMPFCYVNTTIPLCR
jgi:hypothetical protein